MSTTRRYLVPFLGLAVGLSALVLAVVPAATDDSDWPPVPVAHERQVAPAGAAAI